MTLSTRSRLLIGLSLTMAIPLACGDDDDDADADGDADADADGDGDGDVGADAGADGGACVQERCACDEPGVPEHDPGTGGGPFVSLSDESSIETEATVAADGQGEVVAAWIAIRRLTPDFTGSDTAIGWVISHDGGDTWSAPHFVPATPGHPIAADPVLELGPDGRFWLAWVANTSALDDLVLLVASLDTAAETFGDPVEVDTASATADKPWLTFDRAGRLLVTWARVEPGTGSWQIMLAASDDGASFDPVVVRQAAPGTVVELPRVCADRDDDPADSPIYVTYHETPNLQPRLWISASSDGGVTWVETATPIATDHIFIDAACVADADEVWVSYAAGSTQDWSEEQPNPAGESVRLLASHDRGASFDPVVIVSDGGAGDRFLLPQLARTPNGVLHLAYYQGVPGDDVSLMKTTSEDGGATFEATAELVAGTFSQCRSCGCFLGDYFGLWAGADEQYLAYPTNEAEPGRSHVRVERTGGTNDMK